MAPWLSNCLSNQPQPPKWRGIAGHRSVVRRREEEEEDSAARLDIAKIFGIVGPRPAAYLIGLRPLRPIRAAACARRVSWSRKLWGRFLPAVAWPVGVPLGLTSFETTSGVVVVELRRRQLFSISAFCPMKSRRDAPKITTQRWTPQRSRRSTRNG